MSPVGIVSIGIGVLVVCTRGPLIVAPGPTLRLFKRMFSTNGRVRALGAAMLPVGVTMLWAGSSDDSTLASLLLLGGLGASAICAFLLVPFPGAFRALVDEIMPFDTRGSLVGWRILGLAVVLAGGLVIYLGVVAL